MLRIYDYIADQAGAERALAYISRIEQCCAQLETFPERGTRRDDVRSGLRVIGFERRVSIAFHVGEGIVTIMNVLYAGRTFGQEVRPDPEVPKS